MSDLPEGWAVTMLGDITDQRGEKIAPKSKPELPFIGMDDIAGHTGRLVGTQRTGDFKSAVARFVPGDLLYGRLRPYLNKVWEATFEGTASAEFIILPSNDYVDRRYLQQLLMSSEFLNFTELVSTGDRPRVSFQSISKFSFPLPPLPEQSRIVAQLDRLSARTKAARAHLARVQSLATRAKQATLAAAFDPAENLAWPMSTVEQVLAEGLIGLVRSKAQQSDQATPYIRMNHYDLNGRWNDKDLTFVDVSAKEFQRFELRPQDLLFNTRNSAELVGKVALWPEGRPGHVFNNNLLRMRFRKEIKPAFAYFYMISPVFREFLESVKNATTSVAAIYQKSLMRGPFPVPEIENQKAIVCRIETTFARIDRMVEEAVSAAHLLDRLDQRLLAKAFRGELVPQDPTDEPADQLLARIQAAHAAAPKPQRGRRTRA